MTIKIGLTGSISSGKTTASKMIAFNRGPLFSADSIVNKIYKKRRFIKRFLKNFNLKSSRNLKQKIKFLIIKNNKNLKILEKIIHPQVRKEMLIFFKKNKHRNLIFCEIPLLIESKLNRYFDKIIFVKSNKNLRVNRYKAKGGSLRLFKTLDSLQIQDI